MQLTGAGLGLRREMLDEALPVLPQEVDFWEVAPENWIPMGGRFSKQLRACTEQAQFTTHGLSLSIGSCDPLDTDLLKQIKQFIQQHDIELYSEHLSYCSADGHMYDLLPIPFTTQSVKHVTDRIHQVQDILKRPLVLENTSYYLAPDQQMSEIEFTNAILKQSGCKLLLDVNNLYVNSINHAYDPYLFLAELPKDAVVYGHIAGHYDEAIDLKVDTHGTDVIEPVWQLLATAYRIHGVFPTLLERDFNIPPLAELLKEVARIKQIQLTVNNEKTSGVRPGQLV
ncbi:HvfB family MNIO-type RiPP peptide maturase [Salinimonas sediminis]|uniref:UPF0276 protein D0Y50_12705 n=1 Tax=Salinimonas sediminis TaxID=2303538 RepID=A0A346NNM8_9ALTE|nr:DUF692 domain-containing protein [Salinimonas sediminis]AXR07135.1 DUF692 domain-containing protein [Salinimonas sediminis]